VAALILPDHAGPAYFDTLRTIHTTLRPRTYLEIGTRSGDSLVLANCASIAVDPRFVISSDIIGRKPVCLMFQRTSDDFFATQDPRDLLGQRIDFAFLDGLHLFEFLLRDFMNTERICGPDSVIALHDCLPPDVYVAERTDDRARRLEMGSRPDWWTGDVWKLLPILQQWRPDLALINLDCGPTGLVLVAHLNPDSRVLSENYESIVERFTAVDLAEYGLERLHAEARIQSAATIRLPFQPWHTKPPARWDPPAAATHPDRPVVSPAARLPEPAARPAAGIAIGGPMLADYADAHRARLLVTITFHFRKHRLRLLFQVIKTLSGFPTAVLDIVVVTNTAAAEDVAAIKRLCGPVVRFAAQSSASLKTLEVRSFPGLRNPWHLPWMHKQIIAGRFVGTPAEYTHYVNLEDDLEFSFENFCYFLKYRQVLSRWGVLPSFLRIELNYSDDQLYSTDQTESTRLDDRRVVKLDGLWFLCMDNPRAAMFVLDQELAREYIASRSFDLEASKQVSGWPVRERASMALCLENVPEGFLARHVVPADPLRLTMPSFAYIYHLANNYTNNPKSGLGKLPVTKLFSLGAVPDGAPRVGGPAALPSIPTRAYRPASLDQMAADADVTAGSAPAVERLPLHPPAVLEIPELAFGTTGPGQAENAVQGAAALRIAHQGIGAYLLRGVELHGKRGIITVGDRVVAETVRDLPMRETSPPEREPDGRIRLPMHPLSSTLPAAYHLLTSNDGDYDHWIIDALARFDEKLFGELGPGPEAVGAPVLLVPQLDIFWKWESLNLIAPPGIPRIAVGMDARLYLQRLVYIPSFRDAAGVPHPALLPVFDQVRFAAMWDQTDRDWPPRRRLYIAPADGRQPVLENAAEVAAAAERADFERVVLSEKSVPDQVRLFAQASHILAPHGAELTNIAFCQRGAALCELQTRSHVEWRYRWLAALRGVRYGCLLGDASEQAGEQRWRVDLAALESVLHDPRFIGG
jgi:capsular polysaccharide biosynthesis protein